jgi:hypothetical protein
MAVMLRIVQLQMNYAKMTGKTPEIPLLLTAGQSNGVSGDGSQDQSE